MTIFFYLLLFEQGQASFFFSFSLFPLHTPLPSPRHRLRSCAVDGEAKAEEYGGEKGKKKKRSWPALVQIITNKKR
jgi:hypothetical protein